MDPQLHPILHLEPIAKTSTEIYVAASWKPMHLVLFPIIAFIHALDFPFLPLCTP